MSKKIQLTLIIFIFAVAFNACGRSKEERALIGSWKMSAGLGTVNVTFSDDGTFTRTVAGSTPFGSIKESESGSWEIQDGELLLHIEKSTIRGEDIGKTEASKIVKIDDSVLVLKGVDEDDFLLHGTFTRVGDT